MKRVLQVTVLVTLLTAVFASAAAAAPLLYTSNASGPWVRMDRDQVVWTEFGPGSIPGSEVPDVWAMLPAGRTQLTSTGYPEVLPAIAGRRVAWVGWPDGDYYDYTGSEIFLFDGCTTRQLTDNSTADGYLGSIEDELRMDGELLAWWGDDGNDREVFLFDGRKVLQLTDNDYLDGPPNVSNGQVVWWDYDGTTSSVWLYKVKTGAKTRLWSSSIPGITVDGLPQIDGQNVAWMAYTASGRHQPMLWDGRRVRTIPSPYDCYELSLKNGRLAWAAHDDNGWYVETFDGRRVRQLTSAPYVGPWGPEPQIDEKGKVVLQQWDGASWDVYYFHGRVVERVADDTGGLDHMYFGPWPQISQGHLAWASQNSVSGTGVIRYSVYLGP